ncbi:TetR/AcrR family transcriptional regulator [Streptomyces sp. NBC_01754]|uniref:TetR/AcrR family transcriptional regulator n=1 Tax=Streptomyces sp. NBC_01754 TaxID=2975930 RepID=UPI002DDC16AE|nr:TetR/AcrR family transcriptional regulator [Streptomyces sp. NBC_01754]WSC93494.1 TetR/AcrR family transcriptional regulator [Streptomyces sp. NBC_01754]
MARQQKRSRRGDDPLTPERIIEAALRISDTEADLDRLTVRRLATELGVGTMTLYSYFRSKEEILDGMADHVLGRMRLPAEPDAGPAEALRTVGHAFLAMMREHPSVVRLFSTRVTDSPPALRGAMEAVLRRLVDAGIPGPLAVHCYGFLITYAIGFASYQTPRQWGRLPADEGAEQRRQRSHFYAGLPIEEFPLVVELADEVAELASDAQFAAGLETYIDSTVRVLDRDAAQA